MSTEYQVEYERVMRDLSRVDARQARLRVYRGHEYFQFVAAVAAGPDLALLGAETATSPGRFWLAFALEAAPSIKDAIIRREIPLPDPTMAYEVFPDVRQAMRRAKKITEEAQGGQIIARFALDGDHSDP